MRLFQITSLTEGYKEAQADFSKTADPNEVKELLDRFKTAVNRNLVTGQERNIDYWRKQGFEQFKSFLTSAEQKITSRQAKGKSATTGKSIRVHEDDQWLVVVPLDKEASCFYGKDTAWCTSKPFASFYEDYFYDKEITIIYFLNKESGSKWAIAYHPKIDKREYFDQNDKSINDVEFENQTGLDPDRFINIVNKNSDKIQEVRDQYQAAIVPLKEMLKNKEISNEVESLLFKIKNIEYIFEYLGYAKDQSGSVIQKVAATYVRTQLCQNTVNHFVAMFFKFSWLDSSLKDKVIQEVIDHVHKLDIEKAKEWYSKIPLYINDFLKTFEHVTDQRIVDHFTSAITKKLRDRDSTILYRSDIIGSIVKNKLANTTELFYVLISNENWQLSSLPAPLFTQENVNYYINKIDPDDRFIKVLEISKVHPQSLSKQLVTAVLKESGFLEGKMTQQTYQILQPLLDIAGIKPNTGSEESEEQVVDRILKTGPSIKSEMDSIVSKFSKSYRVIDAFLQVGLVPNINWNDTIGMLLLLKTNSDKVVQFLLSKGIVDRDDAYQKLEQLGVPVQNESIGRIKKLAGLN